MKATVQKGFTLIEIMIDEDVITTRASLTTIREAAIARLAKSK